MSCINIIHELKVLGCHLFQCVMGMLVPIEVEGRKGVIERKELHKLRMKDTFLLDLRE